MEAQKQPPRHGMKVTPESTPEALLRRAAAGDEDAFRALYRQLSGGIYRFALHMSGNESMAEEVTQEVFLMLIRDPGRFDAARGPLKPFLYGVARNHVLRCLERESRFTPLADPDAVPNAEAEEAALSPSRSFGTPVGDARDDLLRRERIDTVRRAVLALPAVYREAVILCDLQELSYEEAATALACAVGTLRSRLHRGRELLATKLRATAAPRSLGAAAASRTFGSAAAAPATEECS